MESTDSDTTCPPPEECEPLIGVGIHARGRKPYANHAAFPNVFCADFCLWLHASKGHNKQRRPRAPSPTVALEVRVNRFAIRSHGDYGIANGYGGAATTSTAIEVRDNGRKVTASRSAANGYRNRAEPNGVHRSHRVVPSFQDPNDSVDDSSCRLVRIADAYSTFCGVRCPNDLLVTAFCGGQLIITALSLLQHVVSVLHFNQIFHCSFNATITQPGAYAEFLSNDLIIFDFGLFHELIQVQECIANYLDGGYMRCLWCIGQLAALLVTLFSCVCLRRPHPYLFWPILVMQNAYCFGLVILTIATADKLLLSILHPVDGHLSLLILVFFTGTCSNHLFNYILWHFYWHRESLHSRPDASSATAVWM
ncbi:hypothetical protein QR680_013149 [Steinernema hermaphroditum]|uniref:Uncharacterized protein n=1 Tax=Steinernema hermaphroditum TaxID=289476 RepID=A0AA39I651_9BILA|nr:hypothetical protein QR680_013149 [Steinernema hermaphroditum]